MQIVPLRFRRMSGVTLVELLLVIAIIGGLVALLLPAVQSAREAARRASCLNNLRQLGIAIQNYEASHKRLPKGSETRPVTNGFPLGRDGVFANAYVHLLPQLEEGRLADEYNDQFPWYWQSAALASATLPTLMCPSTYDADNPYFDSLLNYLSEALSAPIGGRLGLTTYVFNKGPNDAFCSDARRISVRLRGMFDYNLSLRSSDVTDGLSYTFAAGEGASGAHWKLCANPGCTQPDLPDPIDLDPYYARQYWIGSGPNKTIFDSPSHWASASIFAATVDPINKNPVTYFLYDDTQSGTQCRGTLEFPGNTHRVPNFRSDHPLGCNFLLGDGSSRFVSQESAIDVVRAMSTIAGEETSGL